MIEVVTAFSSGTITLPFLLLMIGLYLQVEETRKDFKQWKQTQELEEGE
jgi:hypothetical protein